MRRMYSENQLKKILREIDYKISIEETNIKIIFYSFASEMEIEVVTLDGDINKGKITYDNKDTFTLITNEESPYRIVVDQYIFQNGGLEFNCYLENKSSGDDGYAKNIKINSPKGIIYLVA